MDAQKNYESVTLTMNQYMACAMQAYSGFEANYPLPEVDVNALIYEPLDEERHFERDARSLDEHIAELRDMEARAPKDCKVVIEFEQDYGYDDDRITVRKMGYWRDPTPEERAEREAENAKAREHNERLRARQAAEAEATERAEFERLAAKFARDSDTRPKAGDAKQGSTRE